MRLILASWRFLDLPARVKIQWMICKKLGKLKLLSRTHFRPYVPNGYLLYVPDTTTDPERLPPSLVYALELETLRRSAAAFFASKRLKCSMCYNDSVTRVGVCSACVGGCMWTTEQAKCVFGIAVESMLPALTSVRTDKKFYFVSVLNKAADWLAKYADISSRPRIRIRFKNPADMVHELRFVSPKVRKRHNVDIAKNGSVILSHVQPKRRKPDKHLYFVPPMPREEVLQLFGF